MNREFPYLWVDIETTGLDPENDKILEIAMETNTLTEFADFHFLLSYKDFNTDDFTETALKMHTKNHLIEDLQLDMREQEMKVATTYEEVLRSVEDEICAELERIGIEKKSLILAGSSVQFDRAFLTKQMPKFAKYFHYRNFDVRTLRLFFNLPTPKRFHRALQDMSQDKYLTHRLDVHTSVNLSILDEVANYYE